MTTEKDDVQTDTNVLRSDKIKRTHRDVIVMHDQPDEEI